MKKCLKKLTLYIALFMIGLLAIPVAVFLGVISLVWNVVDRIITKLE